MKANVLGTEYENKITNSDIEPYLKDMDGYCDETTKTIVVDEMKPDETRKQQQQAFTDKRGCRKGSVCRHT